MITIKISEEVNILREGGKKLAMILEKIVEAAKPGVSTMDLDRLAEGLIFASGGKPSFKGYKIREASVPYPASLCVSVNDEVVHAIPRSDRILQEGDVVGLDIGMAWPSQEFRIKNLEFRNSRSMFTDMAVTVGVGKVSSGAERLIRATKEALDNGIRAVKLGAHVGDISFSIQEHLEKYKLGIIRDLAGHGVGYAVHEEPLIPNFGKPGTGPELKEGMVLAIEPMATLGDWRLKLDDDEWTFRTKDASLAAHFEHTVAIVDNRSEILTLC